MPWQLIYTSAPRGLLSGQSGFCTVARSRDLREALVQRLEQISSYHYLRPAEATTANRNPTVSAFRILDLRGTKYHVLTRIQPAGLDFTARTNHLAHHLVFQGNELSQLPSPAAILRYWDGWLASWQGEPGVLEDPSIDSFAMAAKSSLPAQTWQRVTGDAGRAAGLLESECIRGCYLLCPPGNEPQVLEMFCETLQLLNLNGQYALRPWRHPFTTFLQSEDNPADFQWRACQEGTPACQEAAKRAIALMPLRSVRVPPNTLAKIARDGQKPVVSSAPAAPTSLRRTLPKEPVKNDPPEAPRIRQETWREPKGQEKKSDFLNINLPLNWATFARLSLFAAVLLGLLAMRFWLFKKHASPPPTAIIEPVKENTPLASQAGQTRPMQSDESQLTWLSPDEPTYLLILPNPASFSLPINSISRFQNLLQRFDRLETRPGDIQMSACIDQWDFQSGAPLTVDGWRPQTPLSAQSATGLQCSFDYSNWKNDSRNPLAVRASFGAPPAAFAIRFGFSNPKLGEPFRLLVVNESNPPVPLHLGLRWLRDAGDSLVASLQPPLGQSLLGDWHVLGDWHWQLQPFVRDKKGTQTNLLYKDWPTGELPPLGSELDFAQVKESLASRQKPFDEKAGGLARQVRQQMEQPTFATPLGADLGLSDPDLASFSSFEPKPVPDDFLQYLNRLRKRAKLNGWPKFNDDETESGLAVKFQRWHDLWINKVPGAQAKLAIGNTNYFAAAWQSLKDLDKIRLEKQRVQDNIEKLREQMQLVPDSLDKVAYVGLFLVDGSKPGLEVIQFAGP